jgi:lactoylglutathione lyase
LTQRVWILAVALVAFGTTPGVHAEEAADALRPGTSAQPRIMFTAIHVADLNRSLAFYTNLLGMREYQRYPGGPGVVEVALTYAAEVPDEQPTDSGAMLLLVYREDRSEPYRAGDAFNRLAIGVPDVAATVTHVADAGYPIVRPPSPTEDGSLTIAIVKDPDGFVVELIGVK